MITSVAVQAYLTRIGALLREQGFNPDMPIIYDSDEAKEESWITDALADANMARKGTTTKEDVRSGQFEILFWTRTSLEPIVRQRYRVIDGADEHGPTAKSTVSASFSIACSFVSNKAEAVEDLEEAFAAVFQNTYNMPLSLQYVYDSAAAHVGPINFTLIQNVGESNLISFKDGNLFTYTWSARIYMNYVSEFAMERLYPVEKIVVDLYAPNGIPLSSLDASGNAHTHTHTAVDGTEVPNVPDEPLIAFTSADPRVYLTVTVMPPYTVDASPIDPEARLLIEGAVMGIGGQVSLRGTDYMMVLRMPLSRFHVEGATLDMDVTATLDAVTAAIKEATGDDYIVSAEVPENGPEA